MYLPEIPAEPDGTSGGFGTSRKGVPLESVNVGG